MGQLYSSYSDLEEKIKAFETATFVKVYKKESRTIEAARKRCPNKNFSEDIKYSEVAFACIHNGKYKPNTKSGARPNQKTSRIGCPFVLKLRTTADGQHLMVTSFVTDHNHEVSSSDYQMNPSVRRLDSTTKEEIRGMMKMNANRKLIQQHFSEKTGKAILMQDIHNLASQVLPSIPSESSKPTTDVQALTTWLKEEHPSVDRHFLFDDNDVVQGIYIQDSLMKSTFEKFPEVLLADSTHKTNENDMPFFALLCIDGNGESHVIAAFLVNKEDEATLREMLKIFTRKNPATSRTSIVLTDKDMTERNVFKSELPHIDLQICLYHVLRTFSRECTTEKLGVTAGERHTILTKLQGFTYARTEEEYEEKYDDFCAVSPNHLVTEYFDRNWHPIKEQWVEGLKSKSLNFNTSTNNRLESFF